ncbi:MAG: nucleotidyltransferase domain-containing protein [Bacteroidetes bacterium]|nr:MAG: nucleotidyltransferase domain-containing protein [Bacteroidota bacterium]
MNAIISNHSEKINALCILYNVKNLFAFGSVCTDKFDEKSDIDLLVSFYPMDFGDYADTYFLFADKLEALFGRKIDLLTDKSLHNPFFIESINQNKILIYEK